MKRLSLRYTLLMVCSILLCTFTSCSHKSEVPEEEITPQTIIVYMVGTDLSWAYSTNKQDIESAISKNIKGRSRVIIVKHSSKQSLKAVEIEYANGKASEKEFATYELPENMDTSTLSYIFSDITSRASAQKYGLIIGSHGWGWVPFSDYHTQIKYNGIADQTLRRKIDTPLPREFVTRFLGESTTPSNLFDIKTLSDALSATGEKFEYILFDACFMANVETVYDLRENTKYIVASLCEIMGNGFPYEQVMPYLLANGGKSYDLNMAAKTFNEHYKSVAQMGGLHSGSVAVIDCAQIESLADKMYKVNSSLNTEIDINQIQSYDGGTNHIFFDLGDYVNKACQDEQYKTAFREQLERCIIAKYTLDKFWSGYCNPDYYNIDTEVFSGITTSVPSQLCRKSYTETSWYQATH